MEYQQQVKRINRLYDLNYEIAANDKMTSAERGRRLREIKQQIRELKWKIGVKY